MHSVTPGLRFKLNIVAQVILTVFTFYLFYVVSFLLYLLLIYLLCAKMN